ncbi:hypothetical protein BDV97DRAFT_294411 [Delphinella strobiligena]|nr:hypothetical protein BDV97DRAFT_294411 [Delphinella strobiligena]
MFLAGAPDGDALDWSDEQLTDIFTLPTKRYLGTEHGNYETSSTQAWSNWRLLGSDDNVFYQSQPIQKNGTRVRTHQDDEFLEFSFAVHADLQSSQLAPQASLGEDEEESTLLSENSLMSTFLEESTILPADGSLLAANEHPPTPSAKHLSHTLTGPIMSIRAIPNAEYLHRLQPQTMTVNIIAGVISIAPTRSVKVRRGNYTMDVVEITLGDDTKAGFCISSWHNPDASQRRNDHLRETLRTLRPQDIVLVEQIALSSFRGQVFGQSLNRKTSKNSTRIAVICNSEELRSEVPSEQNIMLPGHVANKLQRVKDWVVSFVGPASRRRLDATGPDSGHGRAAQRRKLADAVVDEYLPPDSQT